MITHPANSSLLIAPPGIPDSRFRKAVLLLTHDHDGGSFALCVNRPTQHTLQDVLEETGIESSMNFPVYWGGPMSPGTVWMLHSSEWDTEHTITINDEWSMTSNISMFHHLADGDCPQHFRIMFGYCSWAQGQLQAELRGLPPWSQKHSWLVADNPGPEWLLEAPVEELWEDAAQLSGQQAVASWL
jgi:putative transcriptional regulator